MGPDRKICYCFGVTRRKLIHFLQIHHPQVASQLSECGGAGTGCGWCVPYLQQLFQDHASGTSGEATPDGNLLTPTEYERLRVIYRQTGQRPSNPGSAGLTPDS